MSGGRAFGSKARRVAGGIGAVAVAAMMLAACSPVKLGAAAVVGSQRITSASLDSDVSDLQAAIPQYLGSVQVDKTKIPNLVLANLVSFAIRNKTAENLGITVSQTQVDAAIAWQYQQNSQSVSNPQQLIVASAVPPQMASQYGRYWAIWLVYLSRVNNGQFPTQENSAIDQQIAKFNAAECKAAQSLHVQVNPQYGNLAYAKAQGNFTVVAASNPLSGTGAAATPAATPTAGGSPLAC
ncbi:MAG TPA: SurA N-terminal domain-containing protein [Trebonia sp.]|nr:SurA N-terminal domain-containing protein [Trebonia sp.]